MRSKFTSFLALAMIVFAASQCNKKKTDEPAEETPATTTPAGPNSVADILAANGSSVSTFTVDPSVSTTVTVLGNIFEIPANSFESSAGLATGIVTLSVKSITTTTKSEIILNGAGANSSNSKLVVTKGCIKTTASQNTQTLRLVPGSSVVINVKDLSGPTSAPMKKFYTTKVTAVDSTQIWAMKADISDIPQVTMGPSLYHKVTLDTLIWLNVGAQNNDPAPKTAVTVSVTGSMFTKANTLVYLSFDGSPTVGALFEISPGVFRISNMPQGQAAHIIGIAAVNGQYYCTEMPYTIPAPGAPTVNLNLNAVTQTQMRTIVASLP